MSKTLLKMFSENSMFKSRTAKHIVSKKQLLQKSMTHSKRRTLNFHKVFKSPELKSLLWKAARASTVEEFNQVLDNMNKINAKSAPLISHADPKYWANVYFEGRRYGHMTSNIAESLNSWLLLARELPILAMLKMIREQLMR